MRDVIAALYRDGLQRQPVDGPQLITAHSGGFRAAVRILAHGAWMSRFPPRDHQGFPMSRSGTARQASAG